jgi:hypothetical protein
MAENHGVEGAEQPDLVEDRKRVGVQLLVLDHAVRVGAALRHERSGHRGKSKQQQQDERRAHARELTPEEAQVADRPEAGLRDRLFVVDVI